MSRTLLGRAPSKAMIFWSFFVAIALEMVPWGSFPVPGFLALILVFWNVYQPRRVGMALAWLLGLVMDAYSGSLLGQHALAYSVLTFGAIALHRRLLWYSIAGQALQLLPLFVLAQLVVVFVHFFFTGISPSWFHVLSPLITAVLWIPLSKWVLGYLNKPSNSNAAIGR
jgi:rod shape-determining protein MreD